MPSYGVSQPPSAPRDRLVDRAPSLAERLEPAVPVPAQLGVEGRGELVVAHARPVAVVEELLLERAEEALGPRVVGAARLARHRALHAVRLAGGLPRRRPVDRAAVRVLAGRG